MMISLLSSSEYFHVAPIKIADSLDESCGICFASGKFKSGLSGDRTKTCFPLSVTIHLDSVFCVFYSDRCVLNFSQVLSSVSSILYLIFCILYSVFQILYFIFCILNFVFLILYFVFSILTVTYVESLQRPPIIHLITVVTLLFHPSPAIRQHLVNMYLSFQEKEYL